MQHPNALTPLNQLADVLPPDPLSRHNFEVLVRSYLQDPRARKHEQAELVTSFNSWIATEPAILQLMSASPQLAQAEPRAPQLVELGTTGIEAVGYLSSGLPAAAGWKTEKLALIDTADKPQALVRFTVIRPLRDLVNAVPESFAK
jgi:hexosaminidase